MATNLTKYRKDLESLIDNGKKLYHGLLYELRNELEYGFDQLPIEVQKEYTKYSFKNNYNGWYNEALCVIKQLAPERLDDFKSYYKIEKRKNISYDTYTISDYMIGVVVTRLDEVVVPKSSVCSKFEQQFYIVKSLEKRFESSLYDIKHLLQADVFDSEIDCARELCKKGFYRAAGAICGVVIEKHLDEVCKQHQIKVTKKNPGINDYDELLKSNNIIDVATWRNIQRLADIRNTCDHHKNIEPTKDNIEELIAGADKLLKTIF